VVISGFVFAATAAFAGQTAAGDGACDRACLTHIFKIQGGPLHEIEALGVSMPYLSKNGWSDVLR
jgi:hypothetical protein